jgi:integrase
MARRGAGEGSVYYLEDRGLYAVAMELEPADGKRRRVVVKAKTKKAALDKMKEKRRLLDQGLPLPDNSTTTGGWLTWWLSDVLPGTVKDGTLTNYTDIVNAYVIPHVGNVPLARLGPEHVQSMMRSLERAGRAPRTVSLARTVLRRSLTDALRWSKVSRNAAALVRAPRKTKTKTDDALSANEAAAVLKAASGDRLEALAVLVLAVGMRQGEALSLRWDQIDLKAGTVKVTESKTDAGRRTVALPPFAVAAMKAHLARQREERMAADYWDDPALVFTSSIGTKLDRRNVLRWWHDLTVRAKVGRRRFHASRHTAATIMLNNGVTLEVVSATLGHAGLAITSDIYAKVEPKLQRTAADAMEGVLGGSRGSR